WLWERRAKSVDKAGDVARPTTFHSPDNSFAGRARGRSKWRTPRDHQELGPNVGREERKARVRPTGVPRSTQAETCQRRPSKVRIVGDGVGVCGAIVCFLVRRPTTRMV